MHVRGRMEREGGRRKGEMRDKGKAKIPRSKSEPDIESISIWVASPTQWT